MNKSEIENEIIRYDAIKEIAEKRLTELIELKADFAEAEKPKLRHGDFGYTDDGYVRIAIKCCKEKNDLMQLGHLEMPVDGCENKMNTALGNIFKIMKDWGKDLEHLAITPEYGGTIDFHPSLVKHKVIHVFTNSTHLSLKEAEEIWCKLGQMIMTLKRKQAL